MTTSIKKQRSRTSVITGIFFIAATVSAIIGHQLYDPLLIDPNFLTEGAKSANSIVGGALGELITCCANIGTAIMLYPYLRRFNESIGMGYVCFRFLEVVFIVIGAISMLALLGVSHSMMDGAGDIQSAKAIAETLKSVYGWAFLLGPNFILGINTFLYSYTFYRTRLVPKSLAILGLTGAIMILIAGLLLMFGVIDQLSIGHIILVLPIAVYEMVLAGRLIIKGYNKPRPGYFANVA